MNIFMLTPHSSIIKLRVTKISKPDSEGFVEVTTEIAEKETSYKKTHALRCREFYTTLVHDELKLPDYLAVYPTYKLAKKQAARKLNERILELEASISETKKILRGL